jgi:hypothetical protein
VLRACQRAAARGFAFLLGPKSGPRVGARNRMGKLPRLVPRLAETWCVRAYEGTARKDTKGAQMSYKMATRFCVLAKMREESSFVQKPSPGLGGEGAKRGAVGPSRECIVVIK